MVMLTERDERHEDKSEGRETHFVDNVWLPSRSSRQSEHQAFAPTRAGHEHEVATCSNDVERSRLMRAQYS
jgi:hypothetical protein